MLAKPAKIAASVASYCHRAVRNHCWLVLFTSDHVVVAGGTDTATSAGYGLSNMADGSCVHALGNIISDPATSVPVRAR